MNVLSLFDGISCAMVALDRASIPVEKYYASEIDKYAIQISNKNYPDIIQLGDVKVVNGTCEYEDIILGNIDLLIGGSPCQDLSIAKKDRKGLSGERSGLFYEYLRILKEVKPKYFILENVNSMPKEAKETITKELFGIEPVMINAALVSAQNRKRLFWVSSRADLCYTCIYEQLLKKIQYKGKTSKTPTASVGDLLSPKSKDEDSVQGLRATVLSGSINTEMLLQRVYEYQQETERQKTKSTKERLPKEILREKKERITRIWKDLSSEQQREFFEVLQKIHIKTDSQNEEGTERSVETEQEKNQLDWQRGITGYVEKDKHGVCILRFYGGFDSRPYTPSEQGWNELFGELTTSLQELQFIQKGQNNICSCCGGIIPLTYKQVDIPLPKDRGILLKDILEQEVDPKYFTKMDFTKRFDYTIHNQHDAQKGQALRATDYKGTHNMVRVGSLNSGGQGDRIYSPDGKSVNLSANGGGRGAKTGLYAVASRTYPRYKQDGVERSKQIEVRKDEKSNALTSVTGDSMIIENTQVRKLTPIECERLQSLPDNYTDGISNTQRYKCLGNAFNVEVVAHILKYLSTSYD